VDEHEANWQARGGGPWGWGFLLLVVTGQAGLGAAGRSPGGIFRTVALVGQVGELGNLDSREDAAAPTIF
jgi:hypothetical protein